MTPTPTSPENNRRAVSSSIRAAWYWAHVLHAGALLPSVRIGITLRPERRYSSATVITRCPPVRLHVGARASSGAFSYAAHSFTFVAEQIELRVVALPQFSYRWQLTKWFEEARQVLRLPEPGAA